jgi:hypothetical protein
VVTLECAICGRSFEGQRTSAKYCSSACKVKARRRREAPRPDPSDELVVTTRLELERLGAERTWEGQLALRLAAALGGEGLSTAEFVRTSRELSRLMSVVEQKQKSQKSRGQPEDAVAKARRARDRKLREAGLI